MDNNSACLDHDRQIPLPKFMDKVTNIFSIDRWDTHMRRVMSVWLYATYIRMLFIKNKVKF